MFRQRVNRHITPTKVPSFNQSKLHFYNAILVLKSPVFALALAIALTNKDDGLEKLLLDKLISEACGDNNILEELITV
jgi:hypothetical protein